MNPRILIAGIGNIFLGDDAFGVEAVQRLTRREWPENVRVEDYGIRGFDLAYALMEPYDTVVLVDAVPLGGAPGTLYLIEPDVNPEGEAAVEMHGMNPLKVLTMVKSMGGETGRILLLGCEPSPGADEEGMGLSAPVEAALDEAVQMVESLVAQLCQEFAARKPEACAS